MGNPVGVRRKGKDRAWVFANVLVVGTSSIKAKKEDTFIWFLEESRLGCF